MRKEWSLPRELVSFIGKLYTPHRLCSQVLNKLLDQQTSAQSRMAVSLHKLYQALGTLLYLDAFTKYIVQFSSYEFGLSIRKKYLDTVFCPTLIVSIEGSGVGRDVGALQVCKNWANANFGSTFKLRVCKNWANANLSSTCKLMSVSA